MTIRAGLVPASAVAAMCLFALGGYSTPTDTGAGADFPTPAGAGSVAGIQLAQPSGSADTGDAAKRRVPESVGSVIGVTFGENSVQVEFAPDAGYEYFAGTTFDIPCSAATAMDGETAVALGDSFAGDTINVWTGACAESLPVQCEVQAVTAEP